MDTHKQDTNEKNQSGPLKPIHNIGLKIAKSANIVQIFK